MSPNEPDLEPYFARYEQLAAQIDSLFAGIRSSYPQEVRCRPGCSDCCYALFDLSLVEAAYISRAFSKSFPSGATRSEILERAGETDRKVHRIKRRAFKEYSAGKDQNAILEELGRERLRCPLLSLAGADGTGEGCLLYPYRPLTCRIYGAPLLIGGASRCCGRNGFTSGTKYPAFSMDAMADRLAALSLDMAKGIGSRYSEIHTVLVPLSMALTTTYDAAYFGCVPGDDNGK